MAGKARRAAARQGQLTRKRKKSQRGPSGIPSLTVADNEALVDSEVYSDVDGLVNSVTGAVADQENETASADNLTTPVSDRTRPTSPVSRVRSVASGRTSRIDTVPQGPGRIRGERPAAYNYVGAELRRIGVLSVSVIVVLIILGIILSNR